VPWAPYRVESPLQMPTRNPIITARTVSDHRGGRLLLDGESC
jgi:hypothetical protein